MDTEFRNLSRLNGRRFDQEDLTRIGVSSDTVTNYEKKAGLILCSPPPGRGRARKFCLIDAYLLRLTGDIICLTGSAIHAVRAANQLLLSEFDEYPEEMPPKDEFLQFKEAVQEDVMEAPPIFYERTAQRYIYTENLEYGFDVSDIHRVFDPLRYGARTIRRMLFFNVTQIFQDVDEQLVSVLEKRYGKDSF